MYVPCLSKLRDSNCRLYTTQMNALLYPGCYEPLSMVLRHFGKRFESNDSNINGILRSGLNEVINFVVHDRKLFGPGEFGNPTSVLHSLLQVDEHPDFCVTLNVTRLSCFLIDLLIFV